MPNDYYIFGGTFDPIHEGHIGVIRELLALNKNLVIAPTASNPFKNSAQYSFERRLEMIELVLNYEKLVFSKELPAKLYLCDHRYSFVCDFVSWWQASNSGNLYWVIGPDLVDEVKKWKNWDQLNLNLYVAKNYANDLHSTDVRNLKKPIHPALVKV